MPQPSISQRTYCIGGFFLSQRAHGQSWLLHRSRGSATRASASAAWPGQSRGSAAPRRPSGPRRQTLPTSCLPPSAAWGSPQSREAPETQSSQKPLARQCQARGQLRNGGERGWFSWKKSHLCGEGGSKGGSEGMLLFSYFCCFPLRQTPIRCERGRWL